MSDFGRLADFMISVFVPLFLGHIVVPPLNGGLVETDVFRGNKFLENIVILVQELFTPSELRSSSYVREKMSLSSLRGGISYKNFTHIFVHVSYDHMFNNLWGIFSTGYYLFEQTDASTVFIVFFASGFLASIPFKSDLRNSTTTINSTILRKLLTEMKKITNIDVFKEYSCGSSGAVFGLLGASTVVAINSCVQSLRKWTQIVKIHIRGKTKKDTFEVACLIAATTVKIYSHSGLGLIIGSIKFCTDIYMKNVDKANGVIVFDKTNHDAHFNGFLVGICFGIFYISRQKRFAKLY